jgi:osmotically-inducible protein OsmY
VTNRIEVTPVVASQQIRKAIEDALERQAEGEAKRIQLEVKGGHVSLTGLVRSWAEKQAVLVAARGTLGVTQVEDRLTIAPYAA